MMARALAVLLILVADLPAVERRLSAAATSARIEAGPAGRGWTWHIFGLNAGERLSLALIDCVGRRYPLLRDLGHDEVHVLPLHGGLWAGTPWDWDGQQSLEMTLTGCGPVTATQLDRLLNQDRMVHLVKGAVLDRGPWRELRWHGGHGGRMALVLADGRRIPAFRDPRDAA